MGNSTVQGYSGTCELIFKFLKKVKKWDLVNKILWQVDQDSLKNS